MKHNNRMLATAIIIALVMAFALSSVSFASSNQDDANHVKRPTVCVDGYVINHREVPVDGTRLNPPLVVYAFGIPMDMAAPSLPELSADVDVEAAIAAAAPDVVRMKAEVDSHGYFKFEKLPADFRWIFAMRLPEDWDSIVPQAGRGQVALMGWTGLPGRDDDKCYRIVFKIRRLFDITVIKWEELLDGSVRPGKGWEITFTPQGDPFVKAQTKQTNEGGSATFTVTPGNWVITEVVKPGWHPVTPPKVALTLDQYAPSGATDPVIFKNREPACTGKIVVEKNGLGRDADGGLVWLGPLAGWNITLSRADGTMPSMTKTTDAAGRVVFDKLHPGVYLVKEHMQVGWKAVSQNPQTVVLEDCETESVLFENEEITGKLTIHGKKTYKVWTGPAGGLGLAGWKITATLVGTDRSVSTLTNALGEYSFDEEDLVNAGIAFPGATVEVCEEDRDNWIHITPKCVRVTFPYPVPADYPGAVVNFTNIQDPPLPGTGVSAPVSSANCQALYTVKAGDTLSGIAQRFGTTVHAIAHANGITNANLIRAGQSLCVR